MPKPGYALRFLCPVLLFSIAAACDLFLQKFAAPMAWQSFALTIRALRFGLFFGAASFLFGRRARFLFIPFWCWFCFVLMVEAVAHFNFGMVLDGDWVMMLAASSGEEMKAFARRIMPAAWVAAAIAMPALAIGGSFLLAKLPYPRISWRSIVAGVLCILPLAIFDVGMHHPVGPFLALITFHLPVDSLHNWSLFRDIGQTAHVPQLPVGIRLDVQAGKEPLGVVVIGESATRSNWGLYGYDRPTTPCLNALVGELLVFRNVTATHSVTGKSLRMAFTDATVEEPQKTHCTFAQKCAAAGYSCTLLSNQTRWGRWEGVETMLFSGCSEKWYLNEQAPPENGERKYDDALLPHLFDRIDAAVTNASPRLFFVHLMGSHADPVDQYPPERTVYPRYEGDIPPGFDENSPAWNVTATDLYDNTIVFTDSVLGDMIDHLKRLHRPTFFVYFSDHGETPRASYWRTESDPDLFAVPFVVWLSPEYRAAYPDAAAALEAQAKRPLRLDHLQEVLAPLARLRF